MRPARRPRFGASLPQRVHRVVAAAAASGVEFRVQPLARGQGGNVLNTHSRYAGGSNFVSLDFVSNALPLPESERRVAWPLESEARTGEID